MSRPTHGGEVPASPLDSVFMQIVHLLPRNGLSRSLGELSDVEIPVGLRETLYGLYARQFGVAVEEAAQPLSAYPSFNAFFTRALKPGLRPVDGAPGAVVSPVDGTLSEFGPILGEGELTQTKGRTYTVQELVGSPRDAEAFVGGSFMTIYLHPRDYHRVHSPVEGRVAGYRYEPGHLFPVNAPSVQSVDRLFAINERVTIFLDAGADAAACGDLKPGEWAGAPAAMVMVGATCVGRMTLVFDDLVSNQGDRLVRRAHYGGEHAVERAGELGAFNLGSTVILLFGPGVFEPEAGLEPGQVMRLGQRIGRRLG